MARKCRGGGSAPPLPRPQRGTRRCILPRRSPGGRKVAPARPPSPSSAPTRPSLVRLRADPPLLASRADGSRAPNSWSPSRWTPTRTSVASLEYIVFSALERGTRAAPRCAGGIDARGLPARPRADPRLSPPCRRHWKPGPARRAGRPGVVKSSCRRAARPDLSRSTQVPPRLAPLPRGGLARPPQVMVHHELDGPVILLDELGLFLAGKDRRGLNADGPSCSTSPNSPAPSAAGWSA